MVGRGVQTLAVELHVRSSLQNALGPQPPLQEAPPPSVPVVVVSEPESLGALASPVVNTSPPHATIKQRRIEALSMGLSLAGEPHDAEATALSARIGA